MAGMLLAERLDAQRQAVMNLARKLSMPTVFDEHLLCYRRVAGRHEQRPAVRLNPP